MPSKVFSGNIVFFFAGKKAAHEAVLDSDGEEDGADIERVRT